jgi:hypothetical protein
MFTVAQARERRIGATLAVSHVGAIDRLLEDQANAGWPGVVRYQMPADDQHAIADARKENYDPRASQRISISTR